jgi:hypothetical protein
VLDLEELGREAAAYVAGVEAGEAREGHDWSSKAAYYFAFLI